MALLTQDISHLVDDKICSTCLGPVKRSDGYAVLCPDLQLCGVVIRQVSTHTESPEQSQQGYASLYEVLMMVPSYDDEQQDMTFPMVPSHRHQEPSVTVATEIRGVRPKRAEYCGAVVAQADASVVAVYLLPVGTDGADNSGAEPFVMGNAEWIPLVMLLRSLRGIRTRQSYSVGPLERRIISCVDKHLAYLHTQPAYVRMLWSPSALHRRQQVVSNQKANTLEAARFCSTAANAVNNPLYHSTAIVPNAGVPLPASEPYADDFEMDVLSGTLMANKKLRRRSNYLAEDVVIDVHVSDMPIPHWAELYPVHAAALRGDVAELNRLLDMGKSAVLKDSDGWTPLHYASWFGVVETARVLMRDWQGAPSEVTTFGNTALHFAAQHGHFEVIQILIVCPIVDPDRRNDDGETALDLCLKYKENDWERSKELLEHPDQFLPQSSRLIGTSDTSFVDYRVYLADGSSKVVRQPGSATTVQQLHTAVRQALQLPQTAYDVFAVWARVDGYSLQLWPDEQVIEAIDTMTTSLEKAMGHPASTSMLMFRRSCFASLHDERKLVSPIVLKFLFDEAVHSFLSSEWPCTVDDAVHLAALLMMLRSGKYDPLKHITGFLPAASLPSFLPAHLLHNQLPAREWEARILHRYSQLGSANRGYGNKAPAESSSSSEGVRATDVTTIHRLFLQYCRQWRSYGAWFFPCEFARGKRQSKARFDLKLGLNREWLVLIRSDTNEQIMTLLWEDVKASLDAEDSVVYLNTSLVHPSKMEVIHQVLRSSKSNVGIASVQAATIYDVIQKMLQLTHDEEMTVQNLRKQQAHLRQAASAETQLAVTPEQAIRKAVESRKRYTIIHSFGTSVRSHGKMIALDVFFKYARDEDERVSLKSARSLLYDLGIWVGVGELESARMFLDTDGRGTFSFRDFVSWWAQSQRRWLFLLDNLAVEKRVTYIKVFRALDKETVGRVQGEAFDKLVKGLLEDPTVNKTERAIRQGLDPAGNSVCAFNDYIDWLTSMSIIDDVHDVA